MASLKEFYYSLEDRAWSVADSLEDKGIKISSFCDKHHISPLLLFVGVIALLVILILLLVGLGSVSYGYAIITVQADGSPVSGVQLSYDFGGETRTATTDNTGKAELELPIGVEVSIIAYKENYQGNTLPYTLEEEEAEFTITISRRVGNLEVVVNPPEGEALPTGSSVKLVGDGLIRTESVVNGVASFSELPAGTTVTIKVKIPGATEIDGGTVTIQEGQNDAESVDVPLTLLNVDLTVTVLDTNGAPVNSASVELFDYDTGASLGSAITVYEGSVGFNVPLGTRVYATVDPSGSYYSSYNGRDEGNYLSVSSDGMTYRARLSSVGKVTVCVYDAVTSTPLNTGTITLKSSSGLSMGSSPVSASCTEFYGLPEGTRIYPEVVVTGYQRYSEPAQSKVIDYSTETSFDIPISPLSSSNSVTVYVTASDCEDDSCLRGIRIKLIEDYTNLVLDEGITSRDDSLSDITSGCCGIVAFNGLESGMQVYATAFDEDYEFVVSGVYEAQDATVIDLSMCEFEDIEDEVGDLEVCVYKDGEEYDNSDVELYNSNGDLLWFDETDDEEGEDHCHIFQNLPDGMIVYAVATGLSGSPSSEDVEIIGGEVQSVTVYSGEEPGPELLKGDVSICLYDSLTSYPLENANISIYDYETRQRIGSLDSDDQGCAIFSEVEAEAVIDSLVTTREVYVVAKKAGYATYNGIVESGVVQMLPEDTRYVTLYLEGHFPICVQVVKEEDYEGVQATVSLYYNDSDDATPIDTLESAKNGTTIFYQSELPDYYFRVSENYTLLAPDPLYHFEKVYVTDGNCAALELRPLPCTLDLDALLDEDSFEGAVEKDVELPLRIELSGDRADTGIVNEGASRRQHSVMLTDGSEANITLKIDGAYQYFELLYDYTDYSNDQELIARFEVPEDDGDYEVKIDVNIEEGCSDQLVLTLEAIEESLAITTDDISIDLEEDNFARFCIYVKDRKGEDIDDATVTVTLDPLDGWNSEYSRSATWNTVKECYVGSFTAAVTPAETGTYILYITAEDGEISDTQQFDAKVQAPLTADELGTPILTATSTPIVIGVNSGSVCATFKERTGDEITDGTVALRLYPEEGWTGSSSGTASYDFARDCYYMSVPMSVIPTDEEGTYVATVVGQTTDGRTTSTTVSIRAECGCNEEDSCESACTCDPDCDDAKSAGAINLFGCLQLASGMGYSASPYSYSNPYGSNYGQTFNQYGMYGTNGMYGMNGAYTGTSNYYGNYPMSSGMYGTNYMNNPYMSSYGSTGGMSVGSGTIGIGSDEGYIGFNWQACKALLNKLGWGGSTGNIGGTNVRSTVQINDNKGIVTTQACTQITSAFKKTDGVLFAVVSGGNKVTCTNAGSTDYQNWRNLVTSTLNNDQFTMIDLEVFTDAATFNSRYPNARVELIQPESGSPVAYDKSSNWVLGSDAVFSFQVKADNTGSSIFPSTPTGPESSRKLVWGAIKKENLAAILQSGTSEMLSGNWVGYSNGVVNQNFAGQRPGAPGEAPGTADPSAPVGGSSSSSGGKTIIISGGEAPSIAGASVFSAKGLDKDTAKKLKKVASSTTLIITANVNDLEDLGEIMTKPVSCGDYRFTEVDEDKITICDDGAEKKFGEDERYVLYDNEKEAYVVGKLVGCGGATELSTSLTSDLSNVGLVCKGKGAQGTVWYLQSASDDYLDDVVGAFSAENPEEGIVPEEPKYFIQCKSDEDAWHSCTFDDEDTRTMNFEHLANMAGDGIDMSTLLECICYGDPEEKPKTVSGVVKISDDTELVSGTVTLGSESTSIEEDNAFEITGITGNGKETLSAEAIVKLGGADWKCTGSKEVDLSQGGDVGEIDVSKKCVPNTDGDTGGAGACTSWLEVRTGTSTASTEFTGLVSFTVDGDSIEATKDLSANTWHFSFTDNKEHLIRADTGTKTGATSLSCNEGGIIYLTASSDSLCDEVTAVLRLDGNVFTDVHTVSNADGSEVGFKKDGNFFKLTGALKGSLIFVDNKGEKYVADLTDCGTTTLVLTEYVDIAARDEEMKKLYSEVFNFEGNGGMVTTTSLTIGGLYKCDDLLYSQYKTKIVSTYNVIDPEEEIKKILNMIQVGALDCMDNVPDRVKVAAYIGAVVDPKEGEMEKGSPVGSSGEINTEFGKLAVTVQISSQENDVCLADAAKLRIWLQINYEKKN